MTKSDSTVCLLDDDPSVLAAATRVVVLTANDDRQIRWKALAAGAAAFFNKPARDDEFIAGIRSAFAAG